MSKFVVMGLLSLALNAWGTSFFERPFPDTVYDAPIIVKGHIGTSRADWSKGEGETKQIYTYFELRVDEVIKGNLTSGTIQMRELGGEKDGVGMQIAGSAHFEKGEEVVVLLNDKNSEGTYDLRGLMMGKYNLKHEDGKTMLIGPGLQKHSDHGVSEKGHHHDTSEAQEWTLESLRHLVKKQGSPRGEGANTSSFQIPGQTPGANPGEPMLQPQPSNPQAPQLQPTTPEDMGADSPWSNWILLIALGGVGVVGVFWAKRRGRSR